MAADTRNTYLESMVLNAEPIELVRILYRTAIDYVREAGECLASGDVAGRGKAISRALRVIAELKSALNHDSGGSLSRRLERLYTYMEWRLLRANLRREAAPLDEVAGLLANLLEAWQKIGSEARRADEEEDEQAMTCPIVQEAAYEGECALHGWSA
ncbi:MAG: flagellar export chaperone FliS [Bryobacteraceae bacterium]